MKEYFRNLADRFMRRVVARWALWITAASLLVTVVAGWTVATQWNISSDLQSLLHEKSPAAQAMDEMNARVGSTSSLFVIVDSHDTEANLEFAEQFSAELRDLKEVSLAHYHNDKTFFENHLLLYFGADTLTEMRRQFEEEIETAKKEANPLFVSVDSEEDAEAEEGASLDEQLSEEKERLKHTEYNEFLVSEDGYAVTIVVRFKNTSTDLVETNSLMAKIREIGGELEPESYHPDMKLQFGGGLVDRKEQYQSIVDDIVLSAGFTVLGIMLLIALYFRRFRAVALVLTPLIMGAIWTLAVAFTAFGQLTTISVFIFAILLGLGIDYGIHLLSSYDERRMIRRRPVEALAAAFTETGLATIIGAATTLTTFLILSSARSNGLSEFGMVAAMGVVFTVIGMFVVLPAMILTLDKEERDSPGKSFFSSDSGVRTPGDPPWFKARVVPASLVATILMTGGALYISPAVTFEENLHDIGELQPLWRSDDAEAASRPEPSEAEVGAEKAAKRLASRTDERATEVREAIDPESFERRREQQTVGQKYSSATNEKMSSVPTVLLFDSPKETLRAYRELEARIREGSVETIRAANSIHAFLPGTPEEQRRRLEVIEQLEALHASEDLSLLDDKTRDRIARFEPSLDVEEPIGTRDLPLWAKRLFREAGPAAKPPREGEPFAYENLIFVTSKVNENVGSDARKFLAELRSIREATETDFRIASPASIYVSTLDQLRYEGLRLISVGLVAILIFLIVVFGSLTRGLVAAIPLGLGLVWMVGLGTVLGVRLDMFNVVIIPAIIGIGVDDGIHFYMRYLENGRGSLWRTIQTVGSTIVMTSLTSMVGFGGLALADYHGVRSIGYLAVVGISTTLLATLLVLPVVLAAAETFEWKSILPEE